MKIVWVIIGILTFPLWFIPLLLWSLFSIANEHQKYWSKEEIRKRIDRIIDK
jgi:hypothetical protein